MKISNSRNLRYLFDCYHCNRIEGSVFGCEELKDHFPLFDVKYTSIVNFNFSSAGSFFTISRF